MYFTPFSNFTLSIGGISTIFKLNLEDTNIDNFACLKDIQGLQELFK